MSRDIEPPDPRPTFDDDRRVEVDRDPPDPGRGGSTDADRRDVAPSDPREVFTRDLPVPHGPEREHFYLRERTYDLRASEVRTLATVGAFRVVPASDLRDYDGRALDAHRGDLRHLRQAGLVRTVPHVLNGQRTTLVSLTRQGRDLLNSHQRQDRADYQRFHAGFVKPREMTHDAHVYRAYLRATERLAEQGARVQRVVLDYELKRDYQQFLQAGNRDRSDSNGRPTRDAKEIDNWAFDHHLPAEDGHVQFPDLRIEYELPDGRREVEDIEVMTAHYRGAHASAKASARFTQYRAATGAGRSGGRGDGRGGVPFDPRVAEKLL
jgi:DNA-binding MarR family transcriptional regulator